MAKITHACSPLIVAGIIDQDTTSFSGRFNFNYNMHAIKINLVARVHISCTPRDTSAMATRATRLDNTIPITNCIDKEISRMENSNPKDSIITALIFPTSATLINKIHSVEYYDRNRPEIQVMLSINNLSFTLFDVYLRTYGKT
jgi:hypothetical protein